MTDSIVANVKSAVKTAMKEKAKQRLATLRLITAEFKRVEVDERIEVDDARALEILDKMVKQRRDSIAQYQDAGRDELAAGESAEIDVIQEFLPQPLTNDEIEAMIKEAVTATGAAGMQDMGKVMGILKPKLQGRADMGMASKQVKAALAG